MGAAQEIGMRMDIHDFQITGIEVLGDDCFSLRLRNPHDQSRYEMCFEHVGRLFVDGFTLQNIVLDVSRFNCPVEGLALAGLLHC